MNDKTDKGNAVIDDGKSPNDNAPSPGTLGVTTPSVAAARGTSGATDAANAAERNLRGDDGKIIASTPRELGMSFAEKNARDAGIYNGIELVTVLVTIKKKTSSIGDVVPEHEVPILRYVHGEENVEVKDPEYGTLFLENDALKELNRLRAKYDDKHTHVVEKVFGNDVGRVSRFTGMDENFDPLAEVQQGEASVQVDKTEAQRKTAAKSAASKKAAKKTATRK